MESQMESICGSGWLIMLTEPGPACGNNPGIFMGIPTVTYRMQATFQQMLALIAGITDQSVLPNLKSTLKVELMILTRQQLESMIGHLDHYTKDVDQVRDILRSLRFLWGLRDDFSRQEGLPEEIENYFSREIKEKTRWLRDHLLDQVNLASYIESHFSSKGKFTAEPEFNEDGDWEGGWEGTSTVRLRLISLMHKLGHTPEETVDAMVEVLHDEPGRTRDFIISKNLGSPFAAKFDPDELNRRLRVHVYGQEHEDALARRDFKAMKQAREKENI
jgi:hypothetical protein